MDAALCRKQVKISESPVLYFDSIYHLVNMKSARDHVAVLALEVNH